MFNLQEFAFALLSRLLQLALSFSLLAFFFRFPFFELFSLRILAIESRRFVPAGLVGVLVPVVGFPF